MVYVLLYLYVCTGRVIPIRPFPYFEYFHKYIAKTNLFACINMNYLNQFKFHQFK